MSNPVTVNLSAAIALTVTTTAVTAVVSPARTVEISVTVNGGSGAAGTPGADGRSAYQVAVDKGFAGDEAAWLLSLKGDPGEAGAPGADSVVPGPDGRSAYQVAVDKGFAGDEAAWLLSLKGDDGEDGAPGADSVVPGPDGRSAYQVAVDKGFAGDEAAWLLSLKGDPGDAGSSLPLWKATTTTAGSTSTVIPADDTIPQSTEGGELITCTITPTSISNFLLLRVSGWIHTSTAGTPSVAVFLDSATSATAAGRLATIPTANFVGNLAATFLIPVSSTAPQTWKIRIGLAGAGTLRWLQTNSGELFSTTDSIIMTIQEVSITA